MKVLNTLRNNHAIVRYGPFWLIFFVGCVLRIIVHLGGPLNFDEVCSWAFARRMPFLNMWQAALSDPSPPLFYAIVHIIIRVFGDSPALMRLSSVVSGIVILPITYWIMGKGGFAKNDRLAAMLIVAVSSMLVYYSQELRAYSMLACCGVLATGLLYACLFSPSVSMYLLYGGVLVVLSYIHRYGFLLIAAHGVCIIVLKQWKMLLCWALASLVVVCFLMVHILYGDFYYSEAPDRVTTIGSIAVLINMLNIGTIQLYRIFGGQPVADAYYPNEAVNILIALAGALTFATVFIAGLRTVRNFSLLQRQWLIVMGICIVCPAVLALVGGTRLMPKPQWLLRGLIYIWPLYYMLAVALCSRLRYKACLIGLIVLINCLTLFPYYVYFSRGKHALALARLTASTTADDVVVAYPWYFYEVVNYYYRGPATKAAFSDEKGWVDPEALRASNAPFDSRSLLACKPPKARGNVYFFWWIREGECIAPFSRNNLFVYDEHAATEWRNITINQQ